MLMGMREASVTPEILTWEMLGDGYAGILCIFFAVVR